VLDSLDSLVYVADMETYEILFINKYGCDTWGDIVGKTCWQALQSGQSGPCDFCSNDKLVGSDGQATGVYRWEFQNTVDNCWYECHDQAIRWIDGRLVRMEIATDVTDRKHIEDELKDSEELHRITLGSISDAVFITDDKGGFTFICPNVSNIFGHSVEQVSRMSNISGLLGGELFDFLELISQGELQNIEREITDAAGRVHTLLITVKLVSIKDGTLLYTCRDITDRKEVEQALQQSEEKYRRFYEGAPLGYQSLDASGSFLDVNEKWLDDMGYSKEEIIGRCFADFVAPDYLERFEQNFPRFKAGGKTRATEFEMMKKDKSRIIVSFDGNVEYDEEGKFKRTHCIMHDITERRRAEEEVRKRRMEVAHASRLSTIGEMASSLAHELNQPLCAILTHAEGCLSMFRSGSSDTEKVLKKLDTVVKQADRAGKIVSRVKGFSMAGKGSRSTVFVNDYVREATYFLETEINRNHIEVLLDLDESIQPVLADPIQIEQVILNLVQNAIEAMAEIPEDKRHLAISTRLSGDVVEFAVKDSGSGIAEEHTGSLFDSFFTTKPEGLGIGLSICQSIIESHGGRLYFINNPGPGVTFFFTLPTEGVKSVS
jgi:PAS domain S-box-containing protein